MDNINNEADTLLIRHLPKILSLEDQEDLIKHFGATEVKCIGNKGPLKYAAFAKFSDNASAQQALKRLHQLSILESTLTVEFAKKSFSEIKGNNTLQSVKLKLKSLSRENNSELNAKKVINVIDGPDVQKVQNNIDSISQKWNARYIFNNKLQYSYPPPSVSILTNIANALASVPKFYVQVLHLMNKMNLPAPFGIVTPTPPIPQEPPPLPKEDIPLPPGQHPEDEIEEATMEVSSTEESELESDNEDEKSKNTKTPMPVQRINKRKIAENKQIAKKKIKLQAQIIPSVPKTQPQTNPAEVFEQANNVTKKGGFKFGQLFGTAEESASISSITPMSQYDLPLNSQANEADDVKNGSELSTCDNVQVPVIEEGGFGKIEPVKNTESNDEESEGEEGEWGAGEFISSRKLRHGQLSSREMKEYSVFKNYQSGEPNTRLYVKNLAKQTVEKDLHYIFGKYVNWEKVIEKNMFDIRLMKEGRMKGQCFITLGNTRKAEDALKDTNGFMLNGKPMVVQFARSAKPKDVQENKGKK